MLRKALKKPCCFFDILSPAARCYGADPALPVTSATKQNRYIFPLSPGPNNDNPNYIIQAGNVFGFILSTENIF
ncbi:hypothetical protein [Dysosmobacter sp.]|uniref:hypothetical protein n=1 Tax=Dysosmobacter sp. TaxID=2591382 RepID=UPI003AF15FDE